MVLKSRQISDNNFQKVSWKNNKVSFFSYLNNIDEIIDWIVDTLEGKWHYKENFLHTPYGTVISISFWFELKEDAILFKMRWW